MIRILQIFFKINQSIGQGNFLLHTTGIFFSDRNFPQYQFFIEITLIYVKKMSILRNGL